MKKWKSGILGCMVCLLFFSTPFQAIAAEISSSDATSGSASAITLNEVGKSNVRLDLNKKQSHRRNVGKYNNIVNHMNQSKQVYASTADDNSDPNGASYLPFNEATGDAIDTEGGSRWYGVVADETCRITTLMVASDPSSDFDLYIYKLDEATGTLDNIGYSCQEAGNDEKVDLIVNEGVYYIQVNAYTGTGTFGLVSYQSINYISREINDTIGTATAISKSCTLTDAIDSPLDMDIYKFSITTEASRKSFTLANPENCNYALYIVTSDNSIYSINSGVTYSLGNGDYYLIVTTSDGTYSNAAPYTVAVTNQDSVLGGTDLLSYNGYLVQQVGANYYINGKLIDFSFSYKYDISAGADYLHASMTLSTKANTSVKNFADEQSLGISFIKYTSTFNGSARDVALFIPIQNVSYTYYRTASASLAPTYVFDSRSVAEAYLIVDVNTGKVIDLFSPNWYYESSASHHSHGIGAVYATSIAQ
ncbi:hypothetical protein [Clostridium sp. BNL1100]|uniref:hypothetical protein n=1 Tax=Clostridium sp. BNL1100 TaxID=755731 RepID=UPI00024A76B8|nr:hypothetical protein [Clostridium sp. BNL1100]AEY65587.1 hypothetical protein Clo1100_1350 [Clostridium sp. BNL1100]